jgi:hypothetical protein
MRRRRIVLRGALSAAAVAAATLALAGCVPSSPAPTKTAAATATSSASPTPDAPTIDLVGTAGQNQAYFDAVNEKFIAAGGDLSGRPFIDELVKAGYPKTNMEVTPDRTAVNLAADNIQFSIRFGSTCLIGQYGNVGYSSTVTKVLGTGRCLVGTTRTIDW